MSEYAGELIMREKKGILIVVSGFSGAGKGTLMKKLMQDYDNYAFSTVCNPKRLSSYPLPHKSAIRITMASTWPAWTYRYGYHGHSQYLS